MPVVALRLGKENFWAHSSDMSNKRPGGESSIGFDESWYYATAKGLHDYAGLESDVRADVCIVGAGYTGISAAIELAERGYSVVVLENYRVGSGASGRNGGVLGMGQRKGQDELQQWLGKDTAKVLWNIACDANQLVRDRIAKYNIDCDLTDGELTVAHKKKYEQELWDYAELLETDYGFSNHHNVDQAEVADMMGVDSMYGGYVDNQAGHIHPLNLILGEARVARDLGVQIFEHSKATHYENNPSSPALIDIHTGKGKITADFMVIACNGYLDKLEPKASRLQMPINNFVLATEPLGEELARSINRDNLAIVDTRFVVNYFHNSPDHRLIFGGGENYSSRYPNDIPAFVRRHMLKVYPQLADVKIDYGWGGTLAITLKRMPNFGRKADNVYWAQGYSGHGIAMANMGGKLVAEAIAGQAERFDLFANIKQTPFPGGKLLRTPALIAGMLYYSLLDRL